MAQPTEIRLTRVYDAPARAVWDAVGAMAVTTDRLVAIGTSTGGTQALELVLTSMPRLGVGVVVQAWAPDAPAMSADEHARATEADYRGVGAPSQGSSSQGSLVRPVAVALDDLEAIVAVSYTHLTLPTSDLV